MSIYYSALNRGFYNDEIHGPDDLPGDIVFVSQEEWQACMDAQARGLVIVPDANGRPVAEALIIPAAKQAGLLLRGTVTVESSTIPAGLYHVDDAEIDRLMHTATAIVLGLGFPGGEAPFFVKLADGGTATFTDTGQFVKLMEGLLAYRYRCHLVVMGLRESLPETTIYIV